MSMDELSNIAPPAEFPEKHTPRQRFVKSMINAYANDLDRGNLAERQSAAALRLVVDAIEHQYEAELVALVRAWRLEREREGGG